MGIAQRWEKLRPLPLNIKEKLFNLGHFFEKEGVILAYLWGSFLRGKTPNDIDIAVLSQRDFHNLREKLWEILGTQRIDLINLKEASPVLRFEIIKNGLLLYKRDDEVENSFEILTIKEYKDTNYLRRRQEKNLWERTKGWFYDQK